jgi:hypothetical protein
MGTFVKLDNENFVIQGVSVVNEVFIINGIEDEQVGVDFLNNCIKQMMFGNKRLTIQMVAYII